ncbi:biliverdin-producing heme oxygenase [Brevundimonas sp. SORGH_AS_0993]|uniref:biliverdin-producing heme oxygenase n=1 Tax=Brevundimonas sp. SORGH_AS_0993 TaxID=3041794 RepID=UPI00277E41D8|nr:biliverdin-producing heme oxygenase [Brevundimonas sp. SORGH_AS_0993]MDQ1154618.1 heme oxygenase [Brevundimonas sp. SORGH_AS_0993]
MTDVQSSSRALTLKALTRETHDQLDAYITGVASFQTIEAYGRFLTVQHRFHRDIDALYDDAALVAALPGLKDRRRLPAILQDMADLGLAPPRVDAPPLFGAGATLNVAHALGWLYVAEGSNMGAALLRKQAARLGLSDEHGARHLAPAPEGPAAHWRSFTAALDAVTLPARAEPRVIEGAEAAFRQVHAYTVEHLG